MSNEENGTKDPQVDVSNEEMKAIVTKVDNKHTTSDGTVVEIYVAKVKSAPQVAMFTQTALKHLGVTSVTGAISIDFNDPKFMLGLFTGCFHELIMVLDSLTSLSYTELEDLDLDDGIAIAGKCWEVNKDFFLQRVKAALGQVLGDELMTAFAATAEENPSLATP